MATATMSTFARQGGLATLLSGLDDQDAIQRLIGRGVLGRLTSRFQQHDDLTWECTAFTVLAEDHQTIRSRGRSRSKAAAKAAAVSQIRASLEAYFREREGALSPVAESDTSEESNVPVGSATSLTKRQQRVIDGARSHLEVMSSIVRAAAAGRPTTILVLDTEVWEQDSSKLLEVGGVFVDQSRDIYECFHFVVKETESLQNELFCSGSPGPFVWGSSATLPLDSVVTELKKRLSRVRDAGDGVLIGHALHNDTKWLAHHGVDLAGVEVSDTNDVYRHAQLSHQSIGLARLASQMGICIDHLPLHNAGNDAALTWIVWLHQAFKYLDTDLLRFLA